MVASHQSFHSELRTSLISSFMVCTRCYACCKLCRRSCNCCRLSCSSVGRFTRAASAASIFCRSALDRFLTARRCRALVQKAWQAATSVRASVSAIPPSATMCRWRGLRLPRIWFAASLKKSQTSSPVNDKDPQARETADLFLALIIRLLKRGGRAAVVLPDGTLFGEGVKTRLKEHLMEECNLHTIVRLPNSVFKPYASIGTNLLFFEKGEPTKDIWFWEHRVPEGQKAYSMTRPIRFVHLQGCIDWWGGKTRKGRAEGPFAWKVTAEEVKARGYNLDIKNPHTVADDRGEPDELLAQLTAAEAETAQLRDRLKVILAEALAR